MSSKRILPLLRTSPPSRSPLPMTNAYDDISRGSSFLSAEELRDLQLAACGEGVLISRKASIYGAASISIGDNVRVDDFALITSDSNAEVRIGDHVHVAAYAALYGGGGILVEDFVGVSARSIVYSTTDDYAGDSLTNPTIPSELTSVVRRRVVLRRHVVLGAGTIVLPGVVIGEGSATGAMTLVNRDLEPWGIYIGVPARLLRPRSRRLLEGETRLRAVEADARRRRSGESPA